MPPRHGKSEHNSHWLPTWYLSWFPRNQVILGGHTAELATSFGRMTRNTIEEHHRALGIRVAQDSSAAHRWKLESGGGMLCAGVGGPITGWGAHLALLDDPIKNAVEAESDVHRESQWRWWTSVFRTRWEPGATVVLTMTRWHEDDTAGRLKARVDPEDLDPWEFVNFPAIAEEDDVLGRKPGDPLWATRYGARQLRAIEKDVGPYTWAGLFQQRPAPLEGGMFPRAQLLAGVREEAPAEAWKRSVRYWDRAATRRKTAARTVGLRAAFLDGVLWVLDVVKCQEEPKEVEDLMKGTAEEDGRRVTQWIEQEPGSSGKTVFDHFARRVLPAHPVRSDRPTGPKEVRAQPLAAKVVAGNVRLLRAPWNRDFVDELGMYPNGRFKDQVDACAGALDKLTTGARQPWDPEVSEAELRRAHRSPIDEIRDRRSPLDRRGGAGEDDDDDDSDEG